MAAEGDDLLEEEQNAETALEPEPESEPEPEPEPYINAADGLERLEGLEGEELPRALILTGVRADVFDSEELRAQLEQLCSQAAGGSRASGGDADGPEPEISFQWLRSFRRVRVNYTTGRAAAGARLLLHRCPFPSLPDRLGCYFAQILSPATSSLQPPKPVKQFLISPPASPPLGWEPRAENEPLVNHELLAALAALQPGDCRELVPPHPREEHPAVVLHAAHAPPPPPASTPAAAQSSE